MAKMMFENLGAIVSNTLTDSIQMIDIDELHESESNFFEVNRIEEFADTILGQGGVKDNLLVRPLEAGGYEIISGHRRRAAVQYLLDRGENISRYLPCLVQSYNDEDMKMLDIVLMNISARQISDAEIWKSYEIIDKILKDKKTAGERFGRVRETLAELLGVSPAQVGKMQNVEKNAIPAVIEAVENGDISISTANEIAKMNEEAQEQLVQQSDLSCISPKDLKKVVQNEKVDTSINFPVSSSNNNTEEFTEPDTEDSEVDTNINFPEDDRNNDAEKAAETITKSDFFRITRDMYQTENPDVRTFKGKGSLASIDILVSDELWDRLADKGLVRNKNSVDRLIYETDNINWNKLVIPDKWGNMTNKISIEDVLTREELLIAKSVADFVIKPENSIFVKESAEPITEIAKVDTNSNLAAFIHENYYELEAIFEAYISLTSDDDEAKLLEEFLPLLHEVKENVRNKVRFGL